MDEILILDAIERYNRGEMSEKEKLFFEEMRKNNPEVDQLAVEHSFFLNELDKYSATKAFKHALHETEAKLADEGLLAKPVLKGKAKLVHMWKKYKRTVAVAASIAAVISIVSAGALIGYSSKYADKDEITLLKRKLDKIEVAVSDVTDSIKINHIVVPDFGPVTPTGATAFLLDGKGYFVTNYHVTESMKKAIYLENNKGEYFQAKAIYSDPNADISILKIIRGDFKFTGTIPYSIKKSSALLAERLYTLGYPRNEIVFSEGYLSAKSGNKGDSTAYQLSIPVNEGNSGGPVLNNSGELVGIITAKNSKADGVAFAAKSANLFSLIEGLKKSDTAYKNIKLPSGTGLKGLDRTRQVEKLEDFVYMVVGN